ncbi:hypothetical protein Tco_1267851 [Tanacetum coccineum]
MAADGGINGTDTEMPEKEVEKETEAKNGIKNKPIKRTEREETAKASSSQPIGYYLKHRINEKLIEGLVDNHRFNDSLSGIQVGKVKGKTYNLLPRGPVYEAILRKKITRKEDTGGNFEIPWIGVDLKLELLHLCRVEKGIKNDIEPIAPIMTVNKLVLEWEEKIKLHQEKEMKFDRWRSKNFKNELHDLVKIEDEMDDEGEVTLYLTRRSLEVLRKFHWTTLRGQPNQLSHVSSPLLSKPREY